jgi:hypothetical protein
MAIPTQAHYGVIQADADTVVSPVPYISNVAAVEGTGPDDVLVTWDSTESPGAPARQYAAQMAGESVIGDITTESQVTQSGTSHSAHCSIAGLSCVNFYPQVCLGTIASSIGTFDAPDAYVRPGAPPATLTVTTDPGNPALASVSWTNLRLTNVPAGSANRPDGIVFTAAGTGAVAHTHYLSGENGTAPGMDVSPAKLAQLFPGGAPYVFELRTVGVAPTPLGSMQASFQYTP